MKTPWLPRNLPGVPKAGILTEPPHAEVTRRGELRPIGVRRTWPGLAEPREEQTGNRHFRAAHAKLRAVADVSDLVQRCQRGETHAFRSLFREHKKQVARVVERMLGKSLDLEDIIQEVFLQVHRNIKDFKGNSQFSTWLYRVTVNVVLMHRRAARSRPILTELPEHMAVRDAGPEPDALVASSARVRSFYRLLDRLSEKKRTVYVLHELEGLSPVEISTIVGAPVLTVRTRLFYARRELASLLREEPELAALADELDKSSESDSKITSLKDRNANPVSLRGRA